MRPRRRLRTAWNVFANHAPLEAQLVITRRCNLSCGFCTEYDTTSAPIPLDTVRERIDALHRLKTVMITLFGGEPLLHPDLAQIVAHARKHSLVNIITNGFLLTEKIVDELNAARLDHMQISVDALEPSDDLFIQKSLKSIRSRLQMLRSRADFTVHANTVLCPEGVDELPELAEELRELGMQMSIGIVHDDNGQVAVEGEPYASAWASVFEGGQAVSQTGRDYGTRLLAGDRPPWHCRAGARYLYVDEEGHVQYCSQQRGRPDKPVAAYDQADLARARALKKGCESGCTVKCAYSTSLVDNAPWSAVTLWIRHEIASRFGRRPPRNSHPPQAAPTEP